MRLSGPVLGGSIAGGHGNDAADERRNKKARQKRAKQRQAVDALGGRAAFAAIAEALHDRAEKRKLWKEREDDKVMRQSCSCGSRDQKRGAATSTLRQVVVER